MSAETQQRLPEAASIHVGPPCPRVWVVSTRRRADTNAGPRERQHACFAYASKNDVYQLLLGIHTPTVPLGSLWASIGLLTIKRL